MKKVSLYFLAITVCCDMACRQTTTSNNDKGASGNHYVYHDSVKIAFDDTGTGDTTLLFIHGWNIDRSYWIQQAQAFKQRYRVVTVDLPGFGGSGHNRQVWSVENYGKDITTVIDSLDLQRLVLIGHSMSGAIAVEAALQNPGKVIAVVGIDNFTNIGYVPSAKDQQFYAAFYDTLRKNYVKEVIDYAGKYLYAPSTDSTIRKRVTDDFSHADPSRSVAILEENNKYPLTQKLEALHKPLFLLNSNWHPTDTTGFIKNNIAYKLFYIGATGHYPMIEKPGAFNALLQQVIYSIGK